MVKTLFDTGSTVCGAVVAIDMKAIFNSRKNMRGKILCCAQATVQ
jgi:hypothetical protein